MSLISANTSVGLNKEIENAPRPEVIIGEGRSGIVVRSESGYGYVYKIPRTHVPEDEQEILFQEMGRHQTLRALGFKTLDSYEIEEYCWSGGDDTQVHYRGRMPDLTNGGRRYVFSVQDAFHYQTENGIPFPLDACPRGKVVNGDAFLIELRQQMAIALEALITINGTRIEGIKLEVPGMFMIAWPVEPGRICLETVIADFHDGQTFNTSGKNEPKFDPTQAEYYESLKSYLTWVVRFYPDLSTQVDDFLRDVSHGLSTLG